MKISYTSGLISALLLSLAVSAKPWRTNISSYQKKGQLMSELRTWPLTRSRSITRQESQCHCLYDGTFDHHDLAAVSCANQKTYTDCQDSLFSGHSCPRCHHISCSKWRPSHHYTRKIFQASSNPRHGGTTCQNRRADLGTMGRV